MFTVLKHKGIILERKELLFGSKFSEIKKLIGEPDWIGKRSERGVQRVQYSNYDLFIDFDKNDNLNFVETYTSKNIKIDDVSFSLAESYENLMPRLKKLTNDWSEDDSGIQSSSLGVGLYADGFKKESVESFEGFSVFPPKYYS